LVLDKMELDKARKDGQHKVYPEGMTIELIFHSVLLEYLRTLAQQQQQAQTHVPAQMPPSPSAAPVSVQPPSPSAAESKRN